MDTISYVAAAAGFVVVAGYAGLNWLRRDRAPHVTDDASILLAEPPEGMTAATAAIVDHQGTPTAFLAALLDLASRDEIRFRAEGEGQLVGVELHGGDSTDPQVRLNRRRPIGEGEAWLLTQLKEVPLATAAGAAREAGGSPDPAAIMGGLGSMMSFLSFAAGEQADDDSPEARARREHGLLDGSPVDPQALAAAVEQGSGRPLSDRQRDAFAKMSLMTQALQDPASIAADPGAFAARVEALTGKPMSPNDLAEMKAWAARNSASSPAPTAAAAAAPGPAAPPATGGLPGVPPYITGEAALRLGAPLFFGSLIENYARRHGWAGGLSFIDRLRWHLIGVGEIVLALILLALGSSGGTEVLTALGLGVGIGGVVTFLAAPAMVATTAAGALMRAQIAAYRRTLAMTFAASHSIGDAVGASGLTWLETPDQSIVWGIALGLRTNVEALLAAYQPAWYTAEAGQALPDAGSMFRGIEAIGSQPGASGHQPEAGPA